MSDSLPKGQDGKPIGNAVEVDYYVVDLPAWDFNKLIGGTVLRLALGMLHKMTCGDIDEFPEALKPLREIADEEQQIELTKELLDFVSKAFAAHNRRIDEAALSNALQPIFDKKEKTMIKTIFEEREAIAEARGEAEGKADMLLKIIQWKFNKIPKKVEKSIRQMTDPVALDSWAMQAAICKSLDEFVEVLK